MGNLLPFPKRTHFQLHRQHFGKVWTARLGALPLVPLCVIGAAGFAFAYGGALDPLMGCDIKGNISVNTGERIYHLPGQDYYDETRIALSRGERWFCTEEDALNAGWRRSRV